MQSLVCGTISDGKTLATTLNNFDDEKLKTTISKPMDNNATNSNEFLPFKNTNNRVSIVFNHSKYF